jgi:hypothetical protein
MIASAPLAKAFIIFLLLSAGTNSQLRGDNAHKFMRAS